MAKTSIKNPITSPLDEADTKATGAILGAILVDLIDLSLIAKQAHWNVVGRQFRDVHLQLDELVAASRDYADQVAERSSAIGVSPDGRARTVAESSGLPVFPADWQDDRGVITHIVATLATLSERMRQRVGETEETDVITQDLLIGITREIEKAHWMWQAQLAG